jgi:hypothetical protein
MNLTYQLTNPQLTDQGSDLYQISYTCTVVDEMSEEVLSDTVSGSANRYNAEWNTIVAGQISTEINALLERAEERLQMLSKSKDIAATIAAVMGGE